MPVEMVDACHVKTLSDWFGWWDGTFEEHTSKDFYDQYRGKYFGTDYETFPL